MYSKRNRTEEINIKMIKEKKNTLRKLDTQNWKKKSTEKAVYSYIRNTK